MKILFIAPHLSTGGMPQYLLKKIQLLKSSCEIYCVEYQNITGGHLIIQRRQIEDILGSRLFTLQEDKKELISLVRELSPDVIHFEEMPEYFCDENVARQIYHKDRSYKIIETSHDSSFNPEDKVFFPDKFAFVSQYQKDALSSLNIPTEVVEYPIEKKQKKDREKSLIDLGLNPAKTHFLNVGLFSPRKNQSEAIEYARKMINEPVQFHFLGNQAESFQDYWQPLMEDLPKNCKIWGERKDVDTFYNAMDVFLFTSKGSTNDKETNPLVLKEAIGWGMPVLMRRLHVYNGMHDKFPNVYYFKDDIQENLSLLKSFISKKDDKPSYLKDYSLRDHPWEVCIDFVVDSSEFKEKVKHIIFADSQNNLTIYWIEASDGYYSGWTFLNAIQKDLNGIDILLYNESGCLLESKNLVNFKNEKKIQATVNNQVLKFGHKLTDSSSWWSFCEVFIHEIYEGVKEGDIVVDIGANLGMFSAYALKHKASKVFSVEPSPETFSHLRDNLKNFKNVHLTNKAIAAKKGKVGLSVPPVSNGSSIFSLYPEGSPSTFSNSLEGNQLIEIDCVDINSFIKDNNIKKINFLKIDCEGGEFDIFKNISKDFLRDNVDKIVCEVHAFGDFSQRDYEEIIKSKLIECGFKIEEDSNLNTEPNFMFRAQKRKIKIAHLLNNISSKREAASINSVKPLAKRGFSYKQFITPVYKDKPPAENCNRPDAISAESGEYLLSSGHYGCYLAHKNAILESVKQDYDAILLVECDCVLQLPTEDFSKKVDLAYDYCLKHNLAYVSFGKQISGWQHDLVEEEFYITDRMSEAHCILIPRCKYTYIKEKLETCPWDVSDLWYNVFLADYKRGIFSKPYTLQHEGISEIDKKFKEGVKV